MAKAIDRVRNADQRSDLFLKTPYWTPEVEADYETWLSGHCNGNTLDAVRGFLDSGVSVSFKVFNGSICCTLTNMAGKDADQPCLITGWSDDLEDALAVAEYKLEVMLHGVWSSADVPRASRRH